MKYTFKNVMILGLGCLLGFTSCSDSWLNTDSTQTAGGDVIFSTTDNAKLVINGICRTMVQQHAYYGQNFNGEGTMKLLYGEFPLYGTGMVSADEQPVYHNPEQQLYL